MALAAPAIFWTALETQIRMPPQLSHALWALARPIPFFALRIREVKPASCILGCVSGRRGDRAH